MSPVDGASAQLVDAGVTQPGGDQQPLLGVSQNASGDDGQQAAADGTLLSVAGHEVIGSHSTSPGGTTSQGTLPDNGLCAASGGSVCADLLYANSDAAHSDAGADANSATGVALLCLLGDDATGSTCSGVSLGVAQGESHLHRDAAGSRSSSSTSLADACVAGGTDCAVSGDVLASHGSADSAGGHDSGGTIAGVGLGSGAGGTSAGAPGDPITVSVPNGCGGANASSALCAALNQNQQGAGTSGGAGTSQSVAQLGTVGGLLGITAAQTKAGATVVSPPQTGQPHAGTPVSTTPQHTPITVAVHGPTGAGAPQGVDRPIGSASADLPSTGGPWLGALPVAAALLVAGCLLLRRREHG